MLDKEFMELEEWTLEEISYFLGIRKEALRRYEEDEDFPMEVGSVLVSEISGGEDRIEEKLYNREEIFYWVFTSPNIKKRTQKRWAEKILRHGKWGR